MNTENKFRLSIEELVEYLAFWLHGVLRPSHKTCLRVSVNYIVAWCESCNKEPK